LNSVRSISVLTLFDRPGTNGIYFC